MDWMLLGILAGWTAGLTFAGLMLRWKPSGKYGHRKGRI